MAITQSEIARRLGVSQVTVSKVLHRSQQARISPELQDEIRRMAQELGYRPRSLTTHNIGYVNRAPALPLAGEAAFLLRIDTALRKANYRLLLTTYDQSDPCSLKEMLNPKTVDGVLFMSWLGGKAPSLISKDIPMVVTADDAVPENVDQVTLDTAGTMERIVNYLLPFGHRRICVVSSPFVKTYGGITTHLEQGARRAMSKAGLPSEGLLIFPSLDDREIEGQLLPVMSTPHAPTAIVIYGTEKVIAVLHLLSRLGLQVPKDVSLVALLDSHMLGSFTPKITTTTALGDAVAEKAVGRIIEKIQNPESEPRRIAIPGEIIPGGSVGPAARNT